MRHEDLERAWNPPRRTARERRNAHVKVIGSLVLLGVVLIALVLALLG